MFCSSQGIEVLRARIRARERFCGGKLAAHEFDVLIVSSGYGGSVAAARIAGLRDPRAPRGDRTLRVGIIERGNEYVPGDFPESLADTRWSSDPAERARQVAEARREPPDEALASVMDFVIPVADGSPLNLPKTIDAEGLQVRTHARTGDTHACWTSSIQRIGIRHGVIRRRSLRSWWATRSTQRTTPTCSIHRRRASASSSAIGVPSERRNRAGSSRAARHIKAG